MLFDCPGQIELYSHVSVFRSFVDFMKRDGWSAAAVYCLDCQFVADPTKFIAGSLQVRGALHAAPRHLHASMGLFPIGQTRQMYPGRPYGDDSHPACVRGALRFRGGSGKRTGPEP